MSSVRSRQDLINPDRVFFRLIDDYANGRLSNDRNQLFKRAVVVDVDNVGGQLEASPPNPPRSIRARIYTSGIDATTPNSALTIFHPFFPSHMLPPISKDEHVLVLFEDPSGLSNGLWLTTVPAYRDLNFHDPEEARPGQPTAVNNFEGTSPPSVGGTSRDRAFGGTSEDDGIRDEVVSSFSTANSPLKDKRILHIGGTHVAGAYGNEVGIFARERGAKSYNSEGRNKWGVFAWLRRRLGNFGNLKDSVQDLIDRHSPDIVLITLGEDDHALAQMSEENYKSGVEQLFSAANQGNNRVIWISSPLPVGSSQQYQNGTNLVDDLIKSVVGPDYLESRDVIGEVGHQPDGFHFNSIGARNWARAIVDKIERSF